MSTKDWKGREIIVSIDGPPEDPTQKKRRGYIPPQRKTSGPFSRRGGVEVEGVAMDIYDLGIQTSGADFDFRHLATVNVNANGTFTITDRNYTTPFNAAILAELAGGAAEPRRITPDNLAQYGTVALGGVAVGEFDEDRGFVSPSGSSILSIGNANPFFNFNTIAGAVGGLSYTKVTATANYSDPDATFAWDRDAQLFLAPRMFLCAGQPRKKTGPSTSDFWVPNYFVEPLPRSYFLNNADFESLLGAPMFTRGYNMFYRGDTAATAAFLGSPAVIASWRSFMQTRPSARLYKWTTTGFYPSSSTVTSEGPDTVTNYPSYLGSTPLIPTDPFRSDSPLPDYYYADATASSLYVSPGLFLGAMRLLETDDEPESWFYFWRKATTTAFSLSTIAQAPGGGSFQGNRWEIRV